MLMKKKITGTFKNGVLKLALPKTAHHPKETKKIELKLRTFASQ